MALSDQYWLAKDFAFIARVQMAAVQAAVAVTSEDPDTAHHDVRSAWATQVLRDPEHYASKMAFGVASNAAISSASTDSDIQYTVNSQWNAYAGVITSKKD